MPPPRSSRLGESSLADPVGAVDPPALVPGVRPDYDGGSIVNLMSSIAVALGGQAAPEYPLLRDFELPATDRPVVLLVLDGVGYEYVMSQSTQGLLQRNTVARMTSVCPSTTASAIASFMTGQAPQQHGLTGWFMYMQELGTVMAVLPFTPRYGGADLSKAGISAADVLDLQAFAGAIPVPAVHIMPSYIADSPVSRVFRGPAESYSYRDLSGFVGLVERAVKTSRGQRFIYAYWPDFDAMAHHHGVSGREVEAHYKGLEFSLSAMLARLDGTGATLMVTADHGFVDCPPEHCVFLQDHPQLESMLQIPLCGEPRFAYCYLRPGTEAAFDAYVASMAGVEACVDSQSVLESGWFGRGGAHPRLDRRIGDRVLVMRPGWQLKDQLLGQTAYAQLGLHGGTSSAEMHVPLVAFDL